MAKNRYLPYGYKIEDGKTIIEPQEAEIIRRIYKEYAQGNSYKKIAVNLTESGIRYTLDKPVWNKNMVARILQNENYGGSDKYPAILEGEQTQAALQMRKPYNHTESAEIKAIKPLLVCGICGEQLRRRLKTEGNERWYCPADKKHIGVALTDEALLESIGILQNHLAENPDLARVQKKECIQIDIGPVRLQNEIDHALSRPKPDLPSLRQKVMELAAEKYATVQDAEHDGTVLAEKIAALDHTGLNVPMLKSIAAQIKVTHSRAHALVLKNGQIIQPSVAEEEETSHV